MIAIIAIKTETHIITCCELFKLSRSVFLFNLTTFDFVIVLRLKCDLGDWFGEVAHFMATESVFVFIESTDGVFLFDSMTLSGTILAILPLGTSNDSTDFLKRRGQKDDCNAALWNHIRSNSYQRKINNSMICSYSHRLFERIIVLLHLARRSCWGRWGFGVTCL